MKRTILIIVVILAIAAIAFAVLRRDRGTETTDNETTSSTYGAPSDDSTGAIDRGLDGIDTGADLDADFKATDDDIKGF